MSRRLAVAPALERANLGGAGGAGTKFFSFNSCYLVVISVT